MMLCLYCFDPRHFSKTKYDCVKCDKPKKILKLVNSDLLVAFGHPEEIIPKLLNNCEEAEVLVQPESAYEE